MVIIKLSRIRAIEKKTIRKLDLMNEFSPTYLHEIFNYYARSRIRQKIGIDLGNSTRYKCFRVMKLMTLNIMEYLGAINCQV